MGGIKQVWVIGEPGTNKGEFQGPAFSTVSNGRVYVPDSRNNRIQVFDANTGAFDFEWTTFDSDGYPESPQSVAVSGTHAYVAGFWSVYGFKLHV